VASPIDCKYAEENDLATSYLSGRLSESEAEAFEQHYLGCERCRNDVKTLSELRAALGRPAVVPIESRPAGVPTLRLLAAAAVVAIAALGVWQLTHRSRNLERNPVLRGSATEALPLRMERLPEGRLTLTWETHPEAKEYSVEFLRSDGVSVWKQKLSETSVTLEGAKLSPPPGVSLLARVDALNTTGQVVATSGLRPLPPP